MRCMFSREPRKSLFGEKFFDSTTSVSPSQRPRGSPFQFWIFLSGNGRLSIGMMRASCAISLMKTTCVGVWTIW